MGTCRSCGASHANALRFCTVCGKPLHAVNEATGNRQAGSASLTKRLPGVVKAGAMAALKSVALSTILLSPGIFLLSQGWTVAGMIWMFIASFGLMAWTYRKPWRLGWVSCLIPPVAAAACYLVQLWLFSDRMPPATLAGPATLLGLGIGFLSGRVHQVFGKDGAIFAQRTIAYLLVWVAAYAVTQALGMLTSSLFAVRAGLITGAFSTAVLAMVSAMLWRRRASMAKADARPAIAGAAHMLLFLALCGALLPAAQLRAQSGDRTEAQSQTYPFPRHTSYSDPLISPGGETVTDQKSEINRDPLTQRKVYNYAPDAGQPTQEAAGALRVLEDLVPKLTAEWRRLFAQKGNTTAALRSTGQATGNADSASSNIVFYGASKFRWGSQAEELDAEGEVEVTLTIERFASAETAVPPVPPGGKTLDTSNAPGINGAVVTSEDQETTMFAKGPYRVTAHARELNWKNYSGSQYDTSKLARVMYSLLVANTVYQFIDTDLEPDGATASSEEAAPEASNRHDQSPDDGPFGGIELTQDQKAAIAAIVAILIAAGIAANVAQAIAAAVASAMQAGVQLTAEEIEAAVANALLEEHDGPLMAGDPSQDGAAQPPPPILKPDGTPFETNDAGDCWMPDDKGEWRWFPLAQAEKNAADWLAEERANADDQARSQREESEWQRRHAEREDQLRASGQGYDPESDTWRKLPEMPELGPIPDMQGVHYGTDWKPGILGADVNVDTLEGKFAGLDELEKKALEQNGDLDRQIDEAQAKGDDWLAARLRENQDRVRGQIGLIKNQRSSIAGAIEEENRRVAEFNRKIDRVGVKDIPAAAGEMAGVVIGNLPGVSLVVPDPDFEETMKRGIAAAQEVRKGEGIRLEPGLIGYDAVKVLPSVTERFDRAMSRVREIDANLDEALRNGDTAAAERLAAQLAEAKTNAQRLSTAVQQHVDNIRRWQGRSAVANLSAMRKGADIAGTAASVPSLARGVTKVLGDYDRRQGIFRRDTNANPEPMGSDHATGAGKVTNERVRTIKVERGGAKTVHYDLPLKGPSDPAFYPPERRPDWSTPPQKIPVPEGFEGASPPKSSLGGDAPAGRLPDADPAKIPGQPDRAINPPERLPDLPKSPPKILETEGPLGSRQPPGRTTNFDEHSGIELPPDETARRTVDPDPVEVSDKVPLGEVPGFDPEFDPPPSPKGASVSRSAPPLPPKVMKVGKDGKVTIVQPVDPDAPPHVPEYGDVSHVGNVGPAGPQPPGAASVSRSAPAPPPAEMVRGRDGKVTIVRHEEPTVPAERSDGAHLGDAGQYKPPPPPEPTVPRSPPPPEPSDRPTASSSRPAIRTDPRVRAIDEARADFDRNPQLKNDRFINMSSERAEQMARTGKLQPTTATGGDSDETFATGKGSGPAGYLSRGETTHVVRVPAENTVEVRQIRDGRYFDVNGKEIPAEAVRGKIIAMPAPEGTGDKLWHVTAEGKLRPEIPAELVERWSVNEQKWVSPSRPGGATLDDL